MAEMSCHKCGNPNALPAPHTGMRLCDACFMGLLLPKEETPKLAFPHGRYDLWADDDDVIGLTVAKTYLHGWPIMRTDPPFMDAYDEVEVGQFIAWCLTNSERLLPMMQAEDVTP